MSYTKENFIKNHYRSQDKILTTRWYEVVSLYIFTFVNLAIKKQNRAIVQLCERKEKKSDRYYVIGGLKGTNLIANPI